MHKLCWLFAGCLLFLFSRLLFLTPSAVFFDSGEYLERFQQPNYFTALASGHVPLHVGYIGFFWPIFQLTATLHLPPATIILVCQCFLSLLAVIFVFGIVRTVSDNQRTAVMSAILFSLVPLFWIANVTIMIETTVVTFLLASTWAFVHYGAAKQHSIIWLIIGSIFFGLAFLSQPFVCLWLPFLWASAWQKRSKFYLAGGGLFFGLLIASLINSLLIAKAQNLSLGDGLQILFLSKLSERAQLALSLKTVLVYSRNFLLPLVRNNTPVLIFLSGIGLWSLIKQKSWQLWWLILLIAPALIVNQWWDSLFFGRHALIVSFGFCFLAVKVLERHLVWFLLLCVYMLLVSSYALALLRAPIPYLQEATAISQLPANGLMIESHYARPQTQTSYQGQIIFVDEPGWIGNGLSEEIKKYLAENKPVFISGAALSEPYGFYTGPYLHTLGLSYRSPFDLSQTISAFTLRTQTIISAPDNLIIFQIISTQPSAYPQIPILKKSPRRLDYAEPITWLWIFLCDNRRI